MSNVSTINQTKQLLNSDFAKQKIKEVVGNNIGSFSTSIIQIQQSNSMLSQANPKSILGAALTAATLNLPLNNSLGMAYIVPFRDNKNNTVEAQFMIGAKGFRQLAIRSGQFMTIHETDVREGEIISRDRLTGAIEFDFIQDEKERSKAKVIGYVSFFELMNGFSSTFYMSKEEIEAHAKKYSQTYSRGFGPWKDNFKAMALKTVVKLNLAKNAPLSIEMQSGIEKDQATIDAETEDIDYVNNDDNFEPQEEKPSLDAEAFKGLKQSVKDGNLTKEDAIEDYDLTDEQIKELK